MKVVKPTYLAMEESVMGETIPYFRCTRLNSTTFVIVENDKYKEKPFIYVKTYTDPPLLVLSDTGCGGIDISKPSPGNLLDFIETISVPSNQERPLNPRLSNGKPSKDYLIICTHCHYDHILGLSQFLDSHPTILASLHGRSFIEEKLPEHSLCLFLGVAVPKYTVSHWAKDYEKISFREQPLGLQVLATPGHTPDELAWYDETERHLYVGDSFYERVAQDKSYQQAIIFPKEGNIVDYMQSLEKLLQFIHGKNAEPGKSPVKIGCGHVTSFATGAELLAAVRKFFFDVIAGNIPVKESTKKRGEEVNLWQDIGEPRFSLSAPVRLVVDAGEFLKASSTTEKWTQ